MWELTHSKFDLSGISWFDSEESETQPLKIWVNHDTWRNAPIYIITGDSACQNWFGWTNIKCRFQFETPAGHTNKHWDVIEKMEMLPMNKLINVRNGDEPVKVTPARFDITQPFKRYIHGIHEAISGYSYDIHQSTGVPMENKLKNMDILRFSCFTRCFQLKNSGYSQDTHDSTAVSMEKYENIYGRYPTHKVN